MVEPPPAAAYPGSVNTRLLTTSFAIGIASVLSVLTPCALAAADTDGFVPLFNGVDLSDWVNVNCAPETWAVKGGFLTCNGKPTGALRTPRQYENFILELEWRHLSSGGNSGIFIWATPIAAPGVPFLRGIEVQVLDNEYNVKGRGEWYTTHGDVFPIHGATMKPFGRHNGQRSFPSEEHSKTNPDWNHYRIVCTNAVIHLSVNGTQVSGGEDCNYRKGYIALESEGGPIQFRNIRIKELPPGNPAADTTAPLDQKWQNLFTGVDLRGWNTNATTAARWTVKNEHLSATAGPANNAATLWTRREFRDAEFVIDCRPAKPADAKGTPAVPVLQLRGSDAQATEVRLEGSKPDAYQRFVIHVAGREVTVTRDGQELKRMTLPTTVAAQGAVGLRDPGAPCDFMNLYFREL